MERKLSSTREAAGVAVLELAKEGRDVVAVSADTSKSMYTTLLKDDFSDRFIDTGIAEQNMMMVAAGLASCGKTAYVASYSVFTSMRCCEQVRTFIAYPGLDVKIIAGIGGLSAGIEGVTHVATEDLGIMRCVANVAVLAPADAVATKKAVKAAADFSGPVYIRVGRDPSDTLFDDSYDFKIGYPVLHKEGKDITLMGCGLILSEVLKAADILANEGIDAGVVEVHTLAPISSTEIIEQEAAKTKKVITVEEHNITGGLGTVISEILFGQDIQLKKMGLPNCFAETGTPAELVHKFGLDSENIVKEAKKLLNK